jgi:hypothetical protein
VKRLLLIAIVCSQTLTWGRELRLLCASPAKNVSEGFGAKMVSIHRDGSVSVKELLRPESTVYWAAVSVPDGVALLSTEARGDDRSTISVVDLNSGEKVKECNTTGVEDLGFVDQWVYRNAAGKLAYLELFVTPEIKGGYLRSFDVAKDVPCESSFSKVTPAEVGNVVSYGTAGIFEITGEGTNSTAVEPNRDLVLSTSLDAEPARLGFKVPQSILELKGQERNHVYLLQNTDQLTLLYALISFSPNVTKSLLLTKDNGKWKVPAWPTGGSGGRAFGHYIAGWITEPRPSTQVTSPGRESWRSTKDPGGFRIGPLFDKSNRLFPGKLFIYDTRTDKVALHSTGQADSQVLLIDGTTVYYRAADKLYRAELVDGGFRQPTLLAQDNWIRDAHWAFLGEETKPK